VSEPLAVAQVVDSLTAGGAERVAVDLANGLARRGLRSHVIATRAEGPLSARVSPQVSLFCARRRARFDALGALRLVRWLRSRRIRVVHTHNDGSAYLVEILRALGLCSARHVYHDHRGPALGDRGAARRDRWLLRRVDAYAAVSEGLRERAARLLGLPAERCVYLPNGVELPREAAAWDGRPTVIQVANVRAEKDHATALRAAARLSGRVPGLRWRFAGSLEVPPRSFVDGVQALARELGLDGCVEWLGAVRDVSPLLGEAHVGVLSSSAEGLPLALLEYLAHGLPVVVTDTGQCRSIVELARAGAVIPPGDDAALADALAALLADPAGARAAGGRGREFVAANFGLEAAVERVAALYAACTGA
jgi:glycosyltransferase involved in cell wall biosynthesis